MGANKGEPTMTKDLDQQYLKLDKQFSSLMVKMEALIDAMNSFSEKHQEILKIEAFNKELLNYIKEKQNDY